MPLRSDIPDWISGNGSIPCVRPTDRDMASVATDYLGGWPKQALYYFWPNQISHRSCHLLYFNTLQGLGSCYDPSLVAVSQLGN